MTASSPQSTIDGRPDDGKPDIESLLNWLEQQPELEYLRRQCDAARCVYKRTEKTAETRIIVNDRVEIEAKDNAPLQRIKDAFWVPARSMRGRSYATPELDGTLANTAGLMSFSTLWDFITTLPVIQLGFSSLKGLSFPVSVIVSVFLLLASNAAGADATDRRRGHAGKANTALLAFILLSAAKTLFSGVGFDLMLGSSDIAGTYARQLSTQKLANDKLELRRLEAGGQELRIKTSECADLEQQMRSLDRNSNEKQFISLFVRAYGSNAAKEADKGLTPEQMVQRYGSVAKIPGVCNQRDVLQGFSSARARPLAESIERRQQLIGSKPPLEYLRQEEPELFRNHFRLSGSGQIEWVNGTEGVAQATTQFYDKLAAGQFKQLGFSLFVLAISVILTGAASVVLYLVSRNEDLKASFSGDLLRLRDRMFNLYQNSLPALRSAEPAPAEVSNAPALDEAEATELKSLRWIRLNGDTADDRDYAQHLARRRLFDLYRKHVAKTGETYYPNMSNELKEYYQTTSDPDLN